MIPTPGCIRRRAAAARRAAVLTLALLVAWAAPALRAQPAFDAGAVLLAAHPALTDSFWSRTVLLAAPEADGGHIGLILNRPTRIPLANLFPRHLPSKIVRDPIYFGGPVGTGTILALMRRAGEPDAGAGMVPLGAQWQLVYAATLIDRVIEHNPNGARYFLGMVTWHPGELEAEAEHGLWSVHPVASAQVLRTDTSRLWQELADPERAIPSDWRAVQYPSGSTRRAGGKRDALALRQRAPGASGDQGFEVGMVEVEPGAGGTQRMLDRH